MDELKVGDRIRVIAKGRSSTGHTGTILSIAPYGYTVAFDQPNPEVGSQMTYPYNKDEPQKPLFELLTPKRPAPATMRSAWTD